MTMDRIIPIGRVFFAIALTAFGIQQLLFGDFVPGRAPAWPAGVPGRLVWAYISGIILIATGAAILSATAKPTYRKTARLGATVSGTMIVAWALVRHVPLVLADTDFGGAWTQFGKALALSGGAFAVAGSLSDPVSRQGAAALLGSPAGLIYLGRVCLGIFMINSGIQHFIWVPFVTSLVPAWIPGPLFWTYFAGVALIAGGAGLIFPPTARLAGTMSGLMVFTWFLILHIPRALAVPPEQLRNEWIAVFESLAVSGLALMLTASARKDDHVPAGQRVERVG
jgi:uncharacterized membrane protein